ncbi:hypothetical protein I302_106355 [Kwoniella bestiolae CBS 10118]|uniref:PB1 domain-containing protein n=1 Tax=Kwoniella bestiolae CBS 10118 TaxID=1296100 RepID=A0A1B9G3Q0_9TREE|nr:hypothetical protein I302_05479 [Kwoniella bestiolae CBS 10118]OCF25655.1 hypothetical protein I302_05479 [Kwoniella bestiolae CBS 10118]
MSLKAELTTWSEAISSYDSGEYDKSIDEFSKISDTSKICWNIGIILATLGRHGEAVDSFGRAVELDGYFAIGYHQRGVSNFMLGNYQDALKDFEDALLYLRGNQTINYEQLGLDFRLYSCEVLFNCGLSKIYLGQTDSGLSDLREAQTQKMIMEHDVIDDAIRDAGRDYNVFSVPVGVLFKPSQKKLKNLASRDYMGKAILVAATDANDAYTTFTGITRLQRGQTPSGAPLDASHPLSRSASVSVIQQSDSTTRMTRSNTVGIGSVSAARSADPTLNRHSRSNTMGNEGSTSLGRSITSVTRPLVKITTDLNFQPSNPGDRQPFSAPVRDAPGGQGRNQESPYPPAQPKYSGTRGEGESPYIKTPPLNSIPRQNVKSSAVTELYDEYYQSIAESPEDGIDIPDNLPPIGGAKRIEAWSNKNPLGASPSVALSRKGSANANVGQNMMGRLQPQPGSFGGKSPVGGSGMPLTRTISAATSNRESNYEVGSENGSWYDMVKIRVKVNYATHKRGMSILPTHTYEIFISLLKEKFPELAREGGQIDVKFKDEDGDILSMRDEGDFEAAVDVARILGEGNGRGEGRLEIWVN